MSVPTDTTNELMTEHLQYAPLTFIDDVINSANAILYHAMDAFESYLRDNLVPAIPTAQSAATDKPFDLDTATDSELDALFTELEFGMAQVETLLENAVDRNFDALELYCLRNVFNVPEDVDGYLRLQHHLVSPPKGRFHWSFGLVSELRLQGLDFETTAKQDQEVDAAIQVTRKRIQEARKMTSLLNREKTKNETHLLPLRENAKKLSYLQEAAKSNDVAPLSEMTDFLTDQLRTLIASLRTLRALPANVKVGSAEEARKMHLEQVIARRFADVPMFGDGGEGWKEQMEQFEKIATLDDLRRGSS